jgi:hypothetical protein
MKKKILVLITSIMFANILSANETLLANMKSMRNSLVLINDGFLYNDTKKIIQGANDLEESTKIFQKHDLKLYLPAHKQNMAPVAVSLSKRLKLYTDDIKTYANNGKLANAADVYPDLVKACTSCHAIIRGW